MPTMTKATPTLADAKAALDARRTELDKQIDATSDALADAGLDAELATDDAKANATAKVKATGARLQALKDERDAVARAITRAGQREEEATKKAAEAAKQKLIKQDSALVAERAEVYHQIASTIKTLAALSARAVNYDRKIDIVRGQIDQALREHPLKQSLAKIETTLATVMAEAGFDRAFPFPPPSRRIHDPADF